jgi:uncharacterized membrane protein
MFTIGKTQMFTIGATVLSLLLVAAVALVGCKKSEEGGRAGTDTFRVVVPAMSTDVKQGEVQTVRVSVERGAGFKQGVKLEVNAPTGLQVDPDSTMVKPGDKGDVQLTITAAKDAPLGEQKIQVKGTPDKGDSTQTEFKITVSAK